MLIVVLIISTAMIVVWFVFMKMVTDEDLIIAAYNKVVDNMFRMEQLKKKDIEKREKFNRYDGVMATVMKVFLRGTSEKEINKLSEQNERLQRGDFSAVLILDMPGYVILRNFEIISYSQIYKTILMNNLELYGKKHAIKKTKQLLAKLLSYSIIGVAISLTLSVLIIAAGNTTIGLAVLTIGTILVLVLIYAMYDEVSDQANKRRENIARQFPNVVSKLALLVTSGTIVDKAWRQTSYSENFELYKEMQKTSEELDNLVSPEVAYGNFINRCNTKETTKLASAIIQNYSKGNEEIGRLLKDMGKEAWLERRHMAKRDSEKANSMLMIPTMLLFFAILVMIMVPIAMNFGGL